MDRNEVEAFTNRWLAAVCAGDLSAFQTLTAESVLDTGTGSNTTRTAFEERARSVQQAFEALEGRVDELLIEGDRIAWRWTLRGVQRAPFLGEAAIGKHIALSGVNFQRLEGGVVTEHFTMIDAFNILRQMRS